MLWKYVSFGCILNLLLTGETVCCSIYFMLSPHYLTQSTLVAKKKRAKRAKKRSPEPQRSESRSSRAGAPEEKDPAGHSPEIADKEQAPTDPMAVNSNNAANGRQWPPLAANGRQWH